MRISINMRAIYIISDAWYSIKIALKRKASFVVFYSLVLTVGIIIGIVLGVGIDDKARYIASSGLPVFALLSGACGHASFFFLSLLIFLFFAIICSSLWFFRVTAYMSLLAVMYFGYLIGLICAVMLAFYGAAALLYLLLCFLPCMLIIGTVICCLSYKCIKEAIRCSVYGRCLYDAKCYYLSLVRHIVAIGIVALIFFILTAVLTIGLVGIVVIE